MDEGTSLSPSLTGFDIRTMLPSIARVSGYANIAQSVVMLDARVVGDWASEDGYARYGNRNIAIGIRIGNYVVTNKTVAEKSADLNGGSVPVFLGSEVPKWNDGDAPDFIANESTVVRYRASDLYGPLVNAEIVYSDSDYDFAILRSDMLSGANSQGVDPAALDLSQLVIKISSCDNNVHGFFATSMREDIGHDLIAAQGRALFSLEDMRTHTKEYASRGRKLNPAAVFLQDAEGHGATHMFFSPMVAGGVLGSPVVAIRDEKACVIGFIVKTDFESPRIGGEYVAYLLPLRRGIMRTASIGGIDLLDF